MASPKEYPQSEDGMRVLQMHKDQIRSATQRFLGPDGTHPRDDSENEKAETLDNNGNGNDMTTPGVKGSTQVEDTSTMSDEDTKETTDNKATYGQEPEQERRNKPHCNADKDVRKVASLGDEEAGVEAVKAAANKDGQRSKGTKFPFINEPSEMAMMQGIIRGALQAQAARNAELQRFVELVQQAGRGHQAAAAEGEPKQDDKKEHEDLSQEDNSKM